MTEYTPKNILITGGCGFIASHVVIRLVQNYPQYKVINIDKLDYCSSRKNLDCINDAPNYKFVHGNIVSKDLIKYLLEEEEIDTVLHFAAETHVDNSFGNSFAFTESNVMGTHVMLETCRVYGKINRFIHVSTDEVYGEVGLDDAGLKEESILAPTNPYAASKAAAEFIARAYVKSFGLPIIITRGNNVYGPHQFPEKVVPKFLLLAQQNKPLPLHGGGNTIRNFIHVSDVANAFDSVLHKGKTGAYYNIGTDTEKSVRQVALDIMALYGISATEDHMTTVRDRAFNDLRYAIDSTALQNLGWKCQVEWEEGLKQTKTWYEKYRNNWDVEVDAFLAAHPTAIGHPR